jgi:signal peptidase II
LGSNGSSRDDLREERAADVARHRPAGIMVAVAAVVFGIDQLTKQLALEGLADGPVEVVNGIFRLRLTSNTGGAFGLLQGIPGFFLIATIAVIGLIVLYARRLDDRRWLVPLGMILGGGLGNLFDRLFRDFDGGVVDFLDFRVWPVFNLADSAIVLGVLAIMWVSFRTPASARR